MLAAALRLIDEQFSPPHESVEEEARRYPFFQWLSRQKVAAEVAAKRPNLTEYDRFDVIASTVKLMERRWTPHDRFIQDLLSYAISVRHWSLHVLLAEDTLGSLLDGLEAGDLVSAIHKVAYEDLRIPTENPSLQRMQLLAAVLADREPDLRQILSEIYEQVDKSWTGLYQTVLSKRGWKLRPGMSFQEFNLILSAAAEGMALRTLVDTTGIIDQTSGTSVLGKLSLAMVVACIDTGDGLSLEDLVNQFVEQTSDKPAT